jgi:hypothetical protein
MSAYLIRPSSISSIKYSSWKINFDALNSAVVYSRRTFNKFGELLVSYDLAAKYFAFGFTTD